MNSHRTRNRLFWVVPCTLIAILSCSPQNRPGPRLTQRQPQAASTDVPAAMNISDARRVQAEVMDFADDMTVRLAEAIDQIESVALPIEARIIAHRLKYTVAHGATIIAAAQNPRIALVDMMVMISLQRSLLEANIVPAHFGPEADRLRYIFEVSETQIRALAAGSLSPDQLAEIDRLIARWLEENADRRYAAYVRFSDFAAARQVTTGQADAGRPSNVLGFLFLDPLAGLDPTTRELEQTRLFAERALFYLQRTPMLVSWQAELLYIDTVAEPEVRQLLANAATTSDSAARATQEFASLREQLPGMISAEREASLASLARLVDEQRREAIDQGLAGLRAEREATIAQIADERERLGPVISDLRDAIESGTILSESLGRTAGGFSDLAGRLGLDEPRAPGSEPFRIQNYTEAIREATNAADRLNELAGSLVTATSPDVLESRLSLVEQQLRGAEHSAGRLLDRAFRLAMLLIVTLIAGLAAVVVLAAALARRQRFPSPARTSPGPSASPR